MHHVPKGTGASWNEMPPSLFKSSFCMKTSRDSGLPVEAKKCTSSPESRTLFVSASVPLMDSTIVLSGCQSLCFLECNVAIFIHIVVLHENLKRFGPASESHKLHELTCFASWKAMVPSSFKSQFSMKTSRDSGLSVEPQNCTISRESRTLFVSTSDAVIPCGSAS